MKFLKYFFVALLSIVVTLIAVNQYVPVLIDVPKKDRLLVDFNFGKEIMISFPKLKSTSNLSFFGTSMRTGTY